MNSRAVNSSRLVTHCTVPGRRRHLSFTRKLVAYVMPIRRDFAYSFIRASSRIQRLWYGRK